MEKPFCKYCIYWNRTDKGCRKLECVVETFDEYLHKRIKQQCSSCEYWEKVQGGDEGAVIFDCTRTICEHLNSERFIAVAYWEWMMINDKKDKEAK